MLFRSVHEAKCAALAQAARAEEVETERIEADLQRSVAPAFEPPPPTLADTPLSCIFGGRTPAAGVPVVPQVEPTQLPPELRKDNFQEQQELASIFLQHGVRLSSLDAKNLLARFEPARIQEAINHVAQTEPVRALAVEMHLWRSMSKQ